MRKPRRIADIISAVYGRRYRLATPRRPVIADDHYLTAAASSILDRLGAFIGRHLILLPLCGVFIVKVFLSLHYYNILVFQESNMMASYSNVNAIIQRRNDIGRNLITATHYYAEYEERVYNELVKLRTSQPGTEEGPLGKTIQPHPPEEKAGVLASVTSGLSTGASLLPSLPKIMAVAEQYPDLKSESNYTVLMVAIVELEKDLALQRIKFNADANIYTTTLRQFPSNIFAFEFGFKNFPYFDSSQEAKDFKLSF